MRIRPLIISSLAALALFGCTDVDSTNLNTAGIKAYLGVTGNASGNAVASAEFQVDDSSFTYVELKDGDSVTAAQGSDTQALDESKVLGVISYNHTFDGKGDEGTSFTLALTRSASTSAPHTTVTLPAKFNVTAPTGDALSYSRANDNIVVTYDNSGKADEMSYTLSGTCIQPLGATLTGDPGTFTISKGSIQLLSASGSTTSCDATLTILRTRKGTLDSAYAGGSAYGAQARTIDFTTNP